MRDIADLIKSHVCGNTIIVRFCRGNTPEHARGYYWFQPAEQWLSRVDWSLHSLERI